MASNQRHKDEKGFSLIEVIISIGIVSFAFVGVMAIFASNIRVELGNRDRITASYLAQEGAEAVRQIRDNTWFEGKNLDSELKSGDYVLAPVNASNITQGWNLKNAANPKVYLHPTSGIYLQTTGAAPGWKDTAFRRTIKITKDAADRYKIAVTVSYGKNGASKVEVVSYLYDKWYNS